MNKALKIILAVFIIAITLFLTALSAFFIITADATLQPEKLIDYTQTISVFDDFGNKIEDTSLQTKQKSIKIENLNQHTINAFIASEDRSFYKHKGLNYKRMLKAMYTNLTSHSFKEGASTISQQLIKNTHLSNDKTIKRKLKEIKLTKQLERRYDKDKILEMYLNTIYFGHNRFGLQSAANFYFDKPASELTLEESATVVGLLTSPNNYSPFKNPQKCIARRNTVLKNMFDCSFIDKETYEATKGLPLTAYQQQNKQGYSNYLNGVFEEFEELNIEPYGSNGGLIVKTYLNTDIQNAMESVNVESDYSYFVRTVSGGIAAIKSNIGSVKRQIGSTAKPIFVYAPALDDKKISIFTKICDEPINYGGYSPENYDKKYHGSVTVSDSIKFSYNVPAVKTLNSLNFEAVENFAKKMNIELDDEDKNLSLALGAMSKGITLKQLSDCYSVFPNSGNFVNSRFIKEITDNRGKVLYKNQEKSQKVFNESTCSLINDVLCETAESGTAKKLKNFSFDVACKTGTCGTKEGNTDAYAVAYTSDYCIGVWLGDMNNKKTNITGGKDCCNVTANLLAQIYKDGTCPPLDKTTGTRQIEIDREEYDNNDKIMLCDENSPKLNRLTVKCASDNLPQEKTIRFTNPTIQKPSILVKNNLVSISLCQTKYYSYLVKRTKNGKSDIIYDGLWKSEITDEPSDGEYEYTVIPYFTSGNKRFEGKEVILPRVIIRQNKSNEKLPDIAFKDWYNQ